MMDIKIMLGCKFTSKVPENQRKRKYDRLYIYIIQKKKVHHFLRNKDKQTSR